MSARPLWAILVSLLSCLPTTIASHGEVVSGNEDYAGTRALTAESVTNEASTTDLQAGLYVNFENFVGALRSPGPGRLKVEASLSGSTVSDLAISAGQRGGVVFSPVGTIEAMAVLGLVHHHDALATIDFGFKIYPSGKWAVWEKGLGDVKTFNQDPWMWDSDGTSVCEVSLNALNQIEYRINGASAYISDKNAHFPLYVGALFEHYGEVRDVRWLGSVGSFAKFAVQTGACTVDTQGCALAPPEKKELQSCTFNLLRENSTAAVLATVKASNISETDSFTMGGIRFSGKQSSQLLLGEPATIFSWRGGGSDWKICPVFNDGFVVAHGNCTVGADQCVTSPRFPRKYNNHEACTIDYRGPPAVIQVVAFATEDGDKLTLPAFGVRFSGRNPAGLDGQPAGPLLWRSTVGLTGRGWKLCPVPVWILDFQPS